MMKFSLAIDKKNRTNVTQARGHNERAHPTQSQLPQSAWLTREGHHTLKPWDDSVLEQAKNLAKRKDAVLAVELVIQVGNQTDWRDLPTDDHKQGKPKQGNSARMNALMEGVRAAIETEIGWHRVISAKLHSDESTPHVHLLFAPIKDGKLQAKEWVGGATKCAQLRQRIHAQVTKHLSCTYTPGAAGGQPHDPDKAAGKSGLVASLRARITSLEQQVQALFSQAKTREREALKVKAANDDFTERVMKKMAAMESELDRLRPRSAPVAIHQALPGALSGGPGRRPGPAPGRG